jgi:glycosyltransferase involved in cell wall biosynthesis
MPRRLKIVLATEGTYPYYTGGVSTWAEALTKMLDDIDFSILAIMMHPYLEMKFEMPANVERLINVPLWGTEEPTEYISGLRFSEIFTRKLKSDRAIRDKFREILKRLLCSIYSKDCDLAPLGGDLVLLYDIFQEYDYRNIFRSRWLWEFFYSLYLRIHQKSPLFTSREFENSTPPELLWQKINESCPGLPEGHGLRTLDNLNGIVELPSFYDMWAWGRAKAGEDKELESLVKETEDSRKLELPLIPLLEKIEVMKLNRLLLEKALPDVCPKYMEKDDEAPSVYDAVESLRWLYRFLITLLTPLPEADLYHSSAAAFCGLPCIIAKLKHGSKFLLTEHGIYVREQYLYASREKMDVHTKRFLMGLIGLVSRLNYFYADQISPVCRYNMRWETRFGKSEEKVKVIYNGIDTERFRRISIERDDRPTVVMVARIDPLKDIETFIRTCAEVRKSIPNVLFKLYGPEVDQDYLEKCKNLTADLGLEGNFVFAGMTSSPEIANNEGDIVLLTSISEAFPFSVIEGMACEKVIISSDVGGTSEVLEGYGFVVQPRNHMEFAGRVVHALRNPAMTAEMGIEARQRILNGFRTTDMVTNYRNAYYSLAGALS